MENAVELGYSLSSEEHPPLDLIAQARRSEEAGFRFALISDHFHPWTHEQGQSSFVWTVLGGIARETKTLRVGTAVTCPTLRIHPALVAQAAATCALLLPDRFALGLGTGENLNEHVTGAPWPSPAERLERLEEAIHVIRRLWSGGTIGHRGEYYTVQEAELFSRPASAPPILVAANGTSAVRLAARIGDGMITTAPDAERVREFRDHGGAGKPVYGQLAVCWDEDESAAVDTALARWPNAAIVGRATSDLPTPLAFEQAAALVRAEDVAGKVVCGPAAERHVEAIRGFAEAGFDHVYVHQVGPNQEGFFRFYEREVLPVVRREERRPEREAAAVDRAVGESFPASDPPPWTGGKRS